MQIKNITTKDVDRFCVSIIFDRFSFQMEFICLLMRCWNQCGRWFFYSCRMWWCLRILFGRCLFRIEHCFCRLSPWRHLSSFRTTHHCSWYFLTCCEVSWENHCVVWYLLQSIDLDNRQLLMIRHHSWLYQRIRKTPPW